LAPSVAARPSAWFLKHQLVFEFLLFDVFLDLLGVAEVAHQHLVDLQAVLCEVAVEQALASAVLVERRGLL